MYAFRAQAFVLFSRLLCAAKKEFSSHQIEGDMIKEKLWNEWVNEPLPVLCDNIQGDSVNIQGKYMSEAQVLESMKQFERKESDDYSACTESVSLEHEHPSEFELSGDESGLQLSEIELEFSDNDADANQGILLSVIVSYEGKIKSGVRLRGQRQNKYYLK